MLEGAYRFNALFNKSLISFLLSALVATKPDILTDPYRVPSRLITNLIVQEQKNSLTEDECSLIAGASFSPRSLVSLIAEVANNCLCFSGSEIRVKFDEIENWRNYTEQNGEDLFACLFFAQKCKSGSIQPWDYCLKNDYDRLNRCLSKGVSENHYHLNGSSPTFYLNWVSLNNAPSFLGLFDTRTSNKFLDHYDASTYSSFKKLCYLSVVTRKYLFWTVQNKSDSTMTESFRSFLSTFARSPKHFFPSFDRLDPRLSLDNPKLFGLSGYAYDYAEMLQKTGNSSIEIGERLLLINLFSFFKQLSDFQKAVFYFYICLKKDVASFFFQNNDAYGFRNFTHFERFGDLFLDHGGLTEEALSLFSGKYLSQNPGLCSAELRIAPKASKEEFERKIRMDILGIEKSAGGNSLSFLPQKHPSFRYFFAVHFIKGNTYRPLKKFPLPSAPRNIVERKKYEAESASIISLCKAPSHGKFKIHGIDAANCEIGCRPEVFGSVYRKLRYYDYPSLFGKREKLGLHFTYHVAEDFIGIVDGLRSIYEAVLFLNMAAGDRLGHCVAAGIDPEKYYSLKNFEIYQKQQDELDDDVFLYFHIKGKRGIDKAFVRNLASRCESEIEDLYGDFNLDSYYRSMQLRGDDPFLYRDYQNAVLPLLYDGYRANVAMPNYKMVVADEKARQIYSLYSFSDRIRKKGEQMCCRKVTTEYIEAVQYLQKATISFLIGKKISIETNPTSNYLIGPISRYCEIPLFSFNRKFWGQEKHFKNIPVTINTDDQGIFRTSLFNEYAIVAYEMENADKIRSGFNGICEKDVFRYLDYLRKLSNKLSFT